MTSKPWHHANESRHARGYGAAWVRTRAIVMQVINGKPSALCAECLKAGRPTPATQCDHIKPKAQGGTDDLDNLQALCGPCHDAKTQAEAAAAQGHSIKPRATFDADGRVIWGDR